MGSTDVRNIARWNGTEWFDIDSGTNRSVFAMDNYEQSLYVAGEFKFVGDFKLAQGFSIWNGISDPVVDAGLLIITPTVNDDTLKFGTVFEIEWSTATTAERITIEVSYDSAKTWETIDNLADATFGKLAWIVPDTNVEFSKIRISDASASCLAHKLESDFFTITSDPDLDVTRLTRPGGTYYTEPFTVGYNNWKIRNTKGNVWPDSLEYLAYVGPGFALTFDTTKNFPNWFLFVDAFGDEYCHRSSGKIRPRALEKWENILTKWGGSCLGFSKSAYLWWIRNDFNTDIILTEEYLYRYEINDFNREAINKHWIYQKGDKHKTQNAEVRNYTPMQTLNSIRNGMENNDPRTLSFSYRTWDDKTDTAGTVIDSTWDVAAHNVAPYAIMNIPDSSGIYYIYIYDSNAPASKNRFVRVDSSNNSWSYPGSNITDTNSRFIPRLPISEYVGLATDDLKAIPVKNNITNHALLFASATEDIIITKSTGGQIGWINNEELNTLPESSPIYSDDPDYQYNFPEGYYLPEGEYKVELSNFENDKTRVSLEQTNSTYTYRRSNADSTQTDRLYINNGMTIVNPDIAIKNISTTSIVANNDIEYYFTLDSLSFAQNDSTVIELNPSGEITIENFGQPKDYSFILWYSDPSIESYTQSLTTVNLAANSTHMLEPIWANLESGSVEIMIDNDMDGTFEDTIIANVATDIDDEQGSLLPDNYYLAQNYPNPFNPKTTISFNLPTKADVKIEIINILGQKIRTLVNKSLAAGVHQFDWDGTSNNGKKVSSGVYFYRLTTDEFVSTKKMLLLK